MLLPVLVPMPYYARIDSLLHYQHPTHLLPGTLVCVPLGSRSVMGIVWDDIGAPQLHAEQIKSIKEVLTGIPPLSAEWRQLVHFCATYYQRSLGEVAINALPVTLKKTTAIQLQRRLEKLSKTVLSHDAPLPPMPPSLMPTLTQEQAQVLKSICHKTQPYLLFGVTGSGKTEVYLRCIADVLAKHPQAQILIMVPEINLTPQLLARIRERFAYLGEHGVICLHSNVTEAQRFNHWLLAHHGLARIVLGTRLAIFTSMPHLSLIIVDEEHDASYKSDIGSRYSARDLAVYRAHHLRISVVLGSATPSLESWHLARDKAQGGRYQLLTMQSRVSADHSGAFPSLRLVNMHHQPKKTILAEPLLAAIQVRIAKGEQSLLLLNQRGYAPVLFCVDCGWKSECPHCSAYRVFHKLDRSLRCHHCGLSEPVMRCCPVCHNLDIRPIGQGTEHLEEFLLAQLTHCTRLDGTAARVARIDADSTKHKGELEALLNAVHEGQIDVLIGTQMVTKGHDFRRITLVAAINPDGALYSEDYRASERLFALLMQASGRAGRDAKLAEQSEMWIQTWQPTHPLFEALSRHDYASYAKQLLDERQMAELPPFTSHALVRAEGKTQAIVQEFLHAISCIAQERCLHHSLGQCITIMPAIPMSIAKVAGVERAQMLIESKNRGALLQFLKDWLPMVMATQAAKDHAIKRWFVDVDPLSI